MYISACTIVDPTCSPGQYTVFPCSFLRFSTVSSALLFSISGFTCDDVGKSKECFPKGPILSGALFSLVNRSYLTTISSEIPFIRFHRSTAEPFSATI